MGTATVCVLIKSASALNMATPQFVWAASKKMSAGKTGSQPPSFGPASNFGFTTSTASLAH